MPIPSNLTRTGLATLALGVAAAGVPSAASAAGHGDRAEDQVSSRVSTKLRSVARSLDRAEGYVEDGDAAKAAGSLASVRRSLAAAQRTTLRKVTADSDGASANARAVERAEHDVVSSTASLYDGQTGDVVSAITTTLTAALDGRDALLSGVGALSDASDYDAYYAKVAKDVASESEDVSDATGDDELTSEATSALGTAATRLATVKTAVDAIVAAAGDDTAATDDSGSSADASLAGGTGGADCGGRAGGPGGRGGRDGQGASGSTDTTTTTTPSTSTTSTSAARFGGGRS